MQRVRASPATRRILAHFMHKFALFKLLNDKYFLCLLSVKRKFSWCNCNSLSRPKKTLKANKTIWQPYGGELGVELGGKIPPPCMREKDARNKQANGQAISANTDILHVGIVSWTRGGVH